MSEAPLHPRRVAAAIERVNDHDLRGWVDIPGDVQETCLAALKMVQKAQRAAGLTPEVADVGSHVLGVVDYVRSAFLRK